MPTEITILEGRLFKAGGSIQGFITLQLSDGLVLSDFTYHQRNGTRWIGLPRRPYMCPGGTIAWAEIVSYADKDAAARFQREAKAAVDKHLAERRTKGIDIWDLPDMRQAAADWDRFQEIERTMITEEYLDFLE
jgi:hypothetical protein